MVAHYTFFLETKAMSVLLIESHQNHNGTPIAIGMIELAGHMETQ